MGDEYGGGVVAIADSVSGELVIVPDAEAIATIAGGDRYSWDDAIEFAEDYSDGVNSDYRLMTRAEALKIFGNSYLVTLAGLPLDREYWTSEEVDLTYAWAYVVETEIIEALDKGVFGYAIPVRKVNFYGLPLIESEFGGGLVYDVVAATRTVHIIPKWADVNNRAGGNPVGWEGAMGIVPILLHEEEYTALPTRAQAVKIFGNSYLVTLAGLPVDENYWTSEEYDVNSAYAYEHDLQTTANELKTSLYYALPVRSETV